MSGVACTAPRDVTKPSGLQVHFAMSECQNPQAVYYYSTGFGERVQICKIL